MESIAQHGRLGGLVPLSGMTSRLGAFVSVLMCGGVLASVATVNELGVKFKVISTGAATTVEIRIAPRKAFDSVTVEGGSGIASLTPPCAFTNIVVGGTYSCRVDMTGKPTDPAITLNVVAQRAVGNQLPETEIHHFSVKNGAYVSSNKSRAASHHTVGGPTTTAK